MQIFMYFEQNENYTSNFEHPSHKRRIKLGTIKTCPPDRNNFTKNKSISNDFGVEEAVKFCGLLEPKFEQTPGLLEPKLEQTPRCMEPKLEQTHGLLTLN